MSSIQHTSLKDPVWLIIVLSIILGISGCGDHPKFKSEWSIEFDDLGTGSSPRCVDLNRDGVLDVVIGAGRNEFEISDSAVLALDGKSGKVLWTAAASDQIVGSASFLDVTGDSIPEIFIGGRGANFLCIDGTSGKIVWRFQPVTTSPVTSLIRFNFFNAQFIPDQDGDRLQDILVSNGGNARAKANSEIDRFPGVLAVFSSKQGQLIAADTMPDGKETYMSPVVHDFDGDGTLTIIFGTGGETLGGNLFRADLSSLLRNDLSHAVRLASEEGHGFIAPPTLTDITGDAVADVIVNWFGGTMMAFDGKSNKLLWERKVPRTESYSTVVPGFFNDDTVPDFFSFYNKGAWPDNKGSVQMMVDGRDGAVLFTDSLGCLGYSSAVTTDIDNDGYDDVIWSVNDFVCNPPSYIGTDITSDRHTLRLLSSRHKTIQTILEPVQAKNVSTTPWIGDLDGDQYLDLVYALQCNTLKIDAYSGIRIERICTNRKISGKPTWGSYLGDDGRGVFAGKK